MTFPSPCPRLPDADSSGRRIQDRSPGTAPGRRPRLLSAVLALLTAALLSVPGAPLSPAGAQAAPYEEVYADAMSALNEWGVINGYADGELHPERYVTRAQFVAMVNRAYGYDQVGSHPFTDVAPGSWYEDDIAIAYNAGYFTGTSESTASPDRELSRQQAMTLLAKNLRLDSVPGEVTEFTDGWAFAPYSRGYVKACVQKGIVNGYPDNTFRPEEPVTRGAMAMMLYRAMGHLITEPGIYEMGDVFGNVTIATPGATLRGTTISGDLYVSGGLGTEAVTLENVRTLGSIVVAGSGEADAGTDSVILRNVEAPLLKVDSITDQYLSLRSEGTTSIDQASLRSSAYLLDRTSSGEGIKALTLEGTNDTYTLTGNVESVTNKGTGNTLRVAAGSVKDLTMDETGTGSKVEVLNDGTVRSMALDTAVPVTGTGDVESLTVAAAGSSATMLPDTMEIRPGVTARIAGETMDSASARESTEEPRLLAGYPRMADVAPTTAVVIFSANKPGTVRWAVSGSASGSVEEEELYNTSAYGSKAVASGRTTISASGTEVRANINGLTAGIDYYLSAILEDSRGQRSPLKVLSFSTPDGTNPAFVSNPVVSLNTYDRASDRSDRYYAQIMATTNKSCQMYWALYNAGSAAPSIAAFRGGSLTGSLDSGIVETTQSLPAFLDLTGLSETTSYDVYLLLADADFARTSTVRKMTFTTVDGTPPYFITLPTPTTARANAIGLTAVVNEDSTVYWVAVKAGTEYPKPPSGQTTVTPDYAILQIASGMNGERNGSARARANQNVTLNVSGLQAQTAYDIWFIAMDAAGNYSVYPNGDPNNPDDPNNPKRTCMVTANTLDQIAPTVSMEFTRYPEDEPKTPYANTDIRVIFSENVQRASTSEILLDLYQAVAGAASDADRAEAKEALAEALGHTVVLYDVTNGGLPAEAPVRTSANEGTIEKWAIDYRNARVLAEDEKIVVLFPTTSDTDRDSALRLSSGSTYYFQIDDICDVSSARNRMPVTRLDRFKTISAQVILTSLSLASGDWPTAIWQSMGVAQNDREIDMSFTVTPMSTALADPTTCWDMLLWSDTSCQFEMYRRSRAATASPTDPASYADDPWQRIQNPSGAGGLATMAVSGAGTIVGQSLHFDLYKYRVGDAMMLLNGETYSLRDDRAYDYAIRFTQVNGSSSRSAWSEEIRFYVSILEGGSSDLGNLAANVTRERYDAAIAAGNVTDIGSPRDLGFSMTKAILGTTAPEFTTGRPIFTPGDTSVQMRLQIDRQGTVYYVVAPVDSTDGFPAVTTIDTTMRDVGWSRASEIPESGDSVMTDASGREILGADGLPVKLAPFYLSTPSYLEVVNPIYDNSEIKTGTVPITSGSVPVTVEGLQPETDYFVYFVIRGTGQTYSEFTQLFRFSTTEVKRPVLTLDLANPIVNVSADRETTADYIVVNYNATALSTLLYPQAFWGETPTGGVEAPAEYPVYAEIETVMDALSTSLARGDEDTDGLEGSVFDKYATDAYKNRVAEYIRAASVTGAGTIIGVGHDLAVAPGSRVVVDCSTFPMSERTQYAFLAVGRSPMGSGDAFRAIYPLTLMDTEAPVVITIQQTLNMDTEIDATGVERILDSASGVVSLTFNEYLFQQDERTTPPTLHPVDRGPIVSERRSMPGNEEYVSIGSMIQSMSTSTVARLSLDEAQVGRRTLTVDIQFYRARDGEYVTFDSDLCDQYSNVRNTPLSVRVSIDRVRQVARLDETGEPVYELISIPTATITSSWDGREARG